MKHPKSSQVYAVAKVFENVSIQFPKGELMMLECEVNGEGHSCGTTHCHAGWYAVMKCNVNKPLDYEHGATQMAEDLGFERYGDVFLWAGDNPDIWGNNYGDAMFADEFAFLSMERPDGAKNIQDISDHWNEVGERLQALENNKQL